MSADNKQVRTLLNQALFYLRFRARSEFEMRHYLEKKSKILNFERSAIDNAIGILIEEKLIDDEKFAEEFILLRSQIKPKGDYAIRAELAQKGISDTIISEALKKNEITEDIRAVSILTKKHNLLYHLPPLEKKARAISILLRKGFNYDMATQAFDKYLENNK